MTKTTHKKCPHGKQKYYCRKCKGKGICEHDRRRNQCKECGGIILYFIIYICSDFLNYVFFLFVGTSICEHDPVRSTCKECRGNIHIIMFNYIFLIFINIIKYRQFNMRT